MCVYAVSILPEMLKYVINQTQYICLEAVKKDGMALQYVIIQTDEICLEAVKQNYNAFDFVINKTPEICVAAYQQSAAIIHKQSVPTILSTMCMYIYSFIPSPKNIIETSIKNLTFKKINYKNVEDIS
jgi:hypothetical protein